jgi:hypothetical protein
MGIGIFIVVDPDESPSKKFKMEKERESSIEINPELLEENTDSLSNKETEKSPPIRIPVVNSFVPNPYSSKGNHFFNG